MSDRQARGPARRRRWSTLAAEIAVVTLLTATLGPAAEARATGRPVGGKQPTAGLGLGAQTALAAAALCLSAVCSVFGLEEVGTQQAYEDAQQAWHQTENVAEPASLAGRDPFYRRIGPFLAALGDRRERAVQSPLWPVYLPPANNAHRYALEQIAKPMMSPPLLGNADSVGRHLRLRAQEAGEWRARYKGGAIGFAALAGVTLTSAAWLALGRGGQRPARDKSAKSVHGTATRRPEPRNPEPAAGAH
ncbi:MAG: hypothetical protein IPL40_11945 [Proteobacteria bacterium]|nr:hypothetical protein [Pseudomonadota bacterium]